MIRPTLGYPTRTAAVEALVAQGLSRREIADEIGGTENSVQQLIYFAEQRVAGRRVVLPRLLMQQLEEHAASRDTSAAELVCAVLEVVVRDDLFEPLLGEPEASGG